MNTIPSGKKKLSGLAITSAVVAILFSIAAAVMVILPIVSLNSSTMNLDAQWNGMFLSPCSESPSDLLNAGAEKGDAMSQATVFDMSMIGKLGKNYLDHKNDWNGYLSNPEVNEIHTFNNIEMILATVTFFGMIAAALFVLIGKLACKTKGGRVTALLFALIGCLIAAGFLVFTIIYINKLNTFFASSPYSAVGINIGIGPILMASFAFVAFLFSCFAVGKKAAFKKVAEVPNRYDPNTYYTPQNNGADNNVNPPYPVNNGFAPVPPAAPQDQNTGFTDAGSQFSQPFAQPPVAQPPFAQPPFAQPVTQPTFTPPVTQPFAPQTAAQNPALEGVSGDYAGAVIRLNPGEKLLIGRDAASCNLVLSSLKKDISRKHLSVEYDAFTGNFKVVDMSSNGTFVNGQQMVKDQEMIFPADTVLSLGSGENQFRLKKV